MWNMMAKGDKEKEKDKDKSKLKPPKTLKDAKKSKAFGRRSIVAKPKKSTESPSSTSAMFLLKKKTGQDETPPIANGAFQPKKNSTMPLPKEVHANPSFYRLANPAPLEALTPLHKAKSSQKLELVKSKLEQCNIIFDFTDAMSDLKSKEVKRSAMVELIDFFVEYKGDIPAELYKEVFNTFRINCLRPLPPPSICNGIEFDIEEDMPVLEPAWPHLELAYQLFSSLFGCSSFRSGVAKPFLDESFITDLLELFNAEDPRERDLVKTSLHVLYGKILGVRAFVRKTIAFTFSRIVYETSGKHNGLSEILEILGSIINGYATPMKVEHTVYLHTAIMPLHKLSNCNPFYPQLHYCVVKYVDKDPTLAGPIVESLLRWWPKYNSQKEALFLAELGDVLRIAGINRIDEALCLKVVRKLAYCMQSQHFQVAERALTHALEDLFLDLSAENPDVHVPIMVEALIEASMSHWHPNIQQLVLYGLRSMKEIHPENFSQVLQNFKSKRQTEEATRNRKDALWKSIESKALSRPLAKNLNVDRIQERAQSRLYRKLEDDVLTELSTFLSQDLHVSDQTENKSLRRRSVIPNSPAVQAALDAHRVHAVGEPQ